ncbi:MAG: MFS transporter [Marinobacter sp.]|nr:MFS transporter [Marinobacter sp.]
MGVTARAEVIYWRLSNLYFWFFALLGALVPYWSLYLEGRGFSYIEIATLMATIQLTKVVAPNLWGWLGDATGRRVRLVRLGSVLAALCFLGVFLEPGFRGLLLVMLAFTFFWNAILPLYEVITLQGLGQRRDRYGRVRLWGSVGFIATVALVGALLSWLPLAALPWILLPLFLGLIVSSLLVPSETRVVPPKAPKGSLLKIMVLPAVLAFFAMNMLLQVSHGAYYTFFSIHLERYGYGKLSIGLLWSLGVLAEILLFLVMHRLLRRFSIRTIALAALALTTVRWAMIAELTHLPVMLVLAQCLHAASYGALHAISVHYVHGYFGDIHHGQGQALYSGLTFGLGGAIGAWLAGFFVQWYTTEAAFWASAVAMLIGLAVSWRWLRPPPDHAQ